MNQSDKDNLKAKIKQNQHEIYAISYEEMDNIIRSLPPTKQSKAQQLWSEIKGPASIGANFTSAGSDAVKLAKLIGDLGGVGAKAYIKHYGGKPHIILKGNPGLRKVLTGTRYGIKNPKVITMGLGKQAAVSTAKVGGILTIVLLTGYRIAEYALTDEATLSRLIGSLATDFVKVGISTAASIGAAMVVGGFTLAIGPILAVVAVGVLTTVVLDAIDQHYGITDKIIAGLDEMGDDIDAYIENSKRNLTRTAAETVNSVIDYVLDSARKTVIDMAKHSLKRFLPGSPRL